MFGCFRREHAAGTGATLDAGAMRYYRQRDLYVGGYGRLNADRSATGAAPSYVVLTVVNPPRYKVGERWRAEAFVENVALCVYRRLVQESAEGAAIAQGLGGVAKGKLVEVGAADVAAARPEGAPLADDEREALRRFWVILGPSGSATEREAEATGASYEVYCDTISAEELRARSATPRETEAAPREPEPAPREPEPALPDAALSQPLASAAWGIAGALVAAALAMQWALGPSY